MNPASPGGTITETTTTTTTVTRTTSFTPRSPPPLSHSPADNVPSRRLYPDLSSFASSPGHSNRSFAAPSFIDSRAGDFPASLLLTPTRSHYALPTEPSYPTAGDELDLNVVTPVTPPRSLIGSRRSSHRSRSLDPSVATDPTTATSPPVPISPILFAAAQPSKQFTRQVPSSSNMQTDFSRLNVPPRLQDLHPPPLNYKARRYYVVSVGRECGIFTR